MSKWINAEEVVHVSIYNEETEDYKVEACTIEEALDKYTDEGCPNAADVAQVRHGEWEPIDVDRDEFHCSLCVCRIKWGTVTSAKYCPMCGAKMDASS